MFKVHRDVLLKVYIGGTAQTHVQKQESQISFPFLVRVYFNHSKTREGPEAGM